ncbi:patatin-like phospholipase family protein [Mesorhizobium sp. M00.F.Ca.ET.217.01.1.1]|uniref:patatin-like phospholipase family protein n=1 Tax=Mesorhizobium sp. M00.F.Ca.ET.217.01.1.1 TaxID=2500529 RepID=UPI001FDEE6CF|nr:patatin-like phospholipase family protein [Mesorhizobium sp. M00.F.Ca.ET.217.01.1.1]
MTPPANICTRLVCQILLAVLLIGCTSTQRVAYLADEANSAQVSGFHAIRTNLDARPDTMAKPPQRAHASSKAEMNYLVISGGGSGGAFSAGVLKAWSETGTRPRFDIVSGVSTGALIAPYAFLGSSYDDRLVDLYTSGVAKNLVDAKWLPTGLLGTSLLKQGPLRKMVERYITEDVLKTVAVEYRKGRRLLVLTSNLDSQRAVIWDMGAIANSGKPDALRLFQDVLIASASIPGVYPAVLIRVHSGNHVFEEMHSDGGSGSQILAVPDGFMTSANPAKPRPGVRLNMYVLVNNALMPEFENVKNNTLSVMARAYSIQVKSQTRSALLPSYMFAQRVGIRFHVASIDRQIDYSVLDPFNTEYMRSVFRLGYSETIAGKLWKDKPIFSETKAEFAP